MKIKKISFKEFINSPGRSGQHVWKPETPITSDKKDISVKKHKIKPGLITPYSGVSSSEFNIKFKKMPTKIII